MKILIVSASIIEVNGILSHLHADIPDGHNARYCNNKYTIDFIITGCGSVFTTYFLQKKLAANEYDLAINLGIAGSYNEKIRNGDVVEIIEDTFAGLGVNRQGVFLTLFEAGLQHPDEKPFKKGRLFNHNKIPFEIPTEMEKVAGATVNMPAASQDKALAMAEKYNAAIETMENAAFFYVCLMENIPFLSLRSISNKAGEDRRQWNIPLAVKTLTDTFIKIVGL